MLYSLKNLISKDTLLSFIPQAIIGTVSPPACLSFSNFEHLSTSEFGKCIADCVWYNFASCELFILHVRINYILHNLMSLDFLSSWCRECYLTQ